VGNPVPHSKYTWDWLVDGRVSDPELGAVGLPAGNPTAWVVDTVGAWSPHSIKLFEI